MADRRGGGVAGFHRGEVEVIIDWFGERLFFFEEKRDIQFHPVWKICIEIWERIFLFLKHE